MCTSTQAAAAVSERSVYQRSKNVVSRQVAGETLVVPICGKVGDLASIYSFNETGSVLWSALSHPRSLESLTSLLCESFDVEPESAQRDVYAFVHEMQAAGLLTSEPN